MSASAPPIDHAAIERRLQGTHQRLAHHHPFFAALLMMAPTVVTEAHETAATDGERLYFNPSFVAPLTQQQLDGLVVHELLHCALLHRIRRGTRDPLLWNIACDIHVNGLIRTLAHLDLPEGCVEEPRLAELCVDEIYARLRTSSHVQRELGVVDVRPRDGLDQAEIERLGAFWSDAMQRARAMESMRDRAAGRLPEGIDRLISEVHSPSLDWRTALWRHVVRTPDDFTGFDRRHVWQGLYVEELEGDGLDVDVCIDTSGSVGDAELSEFLGELRGILSAYPSVRCRLYYADARCTGPFEVAGTEPLPVAKGGGGTDFRPFFEASAGGEASRFGHERLAVYLTDGHGVFPKRPPNRPVLWVVTPGGVVDAKFPFGEVVRMRTGGRP